MFARLLSISSRVAQWKRTGPITQRSEDQNLALLTNLLFAKMAFLLERVVNTNEADSKCTNVDGHVGFP